MKFYARPEHVCFVVGTTRMLGCRHIEDDTWSYDQDPFLVPDKAPEASVYAAECRAGAIWAADEATAQACGAKFVSVEWTGESTGYRPVAVKPKASKAVA